MVEEGITQWFKGLRRTCDDAGVVGGKNGSRCYSSLNHGDGGKGFRKMAVLVPGETDTKETDKNKAKNDKTKHKVEKIEKDEVNRSRKSEVKARGQQKSTSGKSKSTPTKPKQKNEDNIT
nr:hypothetical protein [Tanacetum cinerariifolium]